MSSSSTLILDKTEWLQPSVYLLKNGDTVVYVGSSEHGLYRALSHACVNPIKVYDTVELIPCSKEQLTELEADLVFKYQPVYNVTVPNSSYVTLRRFRQKYVSWNDNRPSLTQLKCLVQNSNVIPRGVFKGEVYYDFDSLCKAVDK